MSLYAEYIAERENMSIVENDMGFATYTFLDKGVYIQDIFCKKEFRGKGTASSLADQISEIAKEKGHTRLFGSVVPSANGSTTSLKVLLSYGFELESSANNFIWLKKDI